jgi:hypothetical protein
VVERLDGLEEREPIEEAHHEGKNQARVDDPGCVDLAAGSRLLR